MALITAAEAKLAIALTGTTEDTKLETTITRVGRIFATVDEFLAGEPEGLLTDVRIDLALVDGQGRIDVVENAFAG